MVATGSLIGEGFDFPRLDTLFMAMPVSFRSVVEQYAGRLNRDYEGKEDVIVYDYVANSCYTVIGESYSAGRIYDKIGKKAKGRVLYVMPKGILCELIM